MHISSPQEGSVASPRAGNLLGALALAVVDRIDRVSAEAAGSLTRAATLVLLDDVPGCSIDWLARRLDLSHSATVRLVDRLATARLVERRPGSDRRTAALHLTADGETAMRRVRAGRAAALDVIVDTMTESQRTALVRTAETLLYGSLAAPEVIWRTCRLCDASDCVDPCCPVLDAFVEYSEGERG
jgi:MarR family transcriptional repressor of emrRAB